VEYLTIKTPFELEFGGVLKELTICYKTYGTLSPKKDNVIWVCHALTANADAQDWWPGLVGPGKMFDPTKYFIVCANMLGSCYGTTGPSSIDPDTQSPYGLDFPFVTIRDMVKVHQLLKVHLGIERIYLGAGGSMGGQQLMNGQYRNLPCLRTCVYWLLMSNTRLGGLLLMSLNGWLSNQILPLIPSVQMQEVKD